MMNHRRHKLFSSIVILINLSYAFGRENHQNLFADIKAETVYPLAFTVNSNFYIYKKSDNIDLFDSLKLGKLGLGRRTFDYAMLGFSKLKLQGLLINDKIISIVDLTIPSNKKRMFVIDLQNTKLLYVTYVAHGRNSGVAKALYFSNEPESYKSSVGFYTTKGTYSGAHGYSMRLEGHEVGFNDKAEARDIVVHSADYVSEDIANKQGYIGRSLGCPALSPQIYKVIIDKIKNGTCLFVYGNDSKYITTSKYLKQPVKNGQ